MDIKDLELRAKLLVRSGVRPTTARTYNTAQSRFLSFCDSIQALPIPCSENTLLLYVAYLSKEGLKASSVRVYLAAIRALHIEEGHGNPLEGYMRVQRAVRALEIQAEPPKQKLPITYTIMEKLQMVVGAKDYHASLIWAAMTLAYFGCLRGAELAHTGQFNAELHLTSADMSFHPEADSIPEHIVVTVKRSKTDKLNKGFKIHLRCSRTLVCAYCALSSMLCRRAQLGLSMLPRSPLFMFPNAMALSRNVFVQQTRLYLSMMGLESSQYSGHSYRSGSATTAAMAGTPDWQIKLLGRWNSDAYQVYVRASTSSMLDLTSSLCFK